MKVVSIGGGPAGLYLGILLKRADARHDVTILERNGPDDTFGWGVVFSDETLSGLEKADPESWEQVASRFVRWDRIDIRFRGETLRSGGHGFAGLSRKVLLQILHDRARALGVKLEFRREVDDWQELDGADLILAADGVNSKTRKALADRFQPSVQPGRARYIWLGTPLRLPAFTFIIRENEHGLFCVHAYPFDASTSTFIVETDDATWRRAGLDRASTETTLAYLSRLFAEDLDGAPLLSNNSAWLQFNLVTNERWHDGRVVLLGDAAHTAHFSIGSGTKLAMEDAIALSEALAANADVPAALQAYEAARRPSVLRLQAVARRSQTWFEEIGRHARLAPASFAFSLLTRSYKVTWRNLQVRDAAYVAGVARAHAQAEGVRAGGTPPPPMLLPFRLRELELRNRIVVSPMCQYSSVDGEATDWHLVHLGSRALGGAGLVVAEMTNVEADGRISPGCSGLWSDAHAAAWRRVTDFIHARTKAAVAVQLAHAGRKASTPIPWESREPSLGARNWPIVGPSGLPFQDGSPTPREMTRSDMTRVRDLFAASTRLALTAGFDAIEVHGAHGYLLSSFLSPLSNRRTDEFGGDLAGRMRFPLEVFRAMRDEWPRDKPMGFRISATDWVPGGFTLDEAVEVVKALASAGCDFVDVSSGGNAPEARPEYYGRMYQVPFAERIRNETGMATLAVGAITDWDQANTILAARRADLVVMAREHLFDPYFTLHAAAEQGARGDWPPQYLAVHSLAPRP